MGQNTILRVAQNVRDILISICNFCVVSEKQLIFYFT